MQKFLPPYSCALNPIEKMWHVVKAHWRRKVVQRFEGMEEQEMIRELTEIK